MSTSTVSAPAISGVRRLARVSFGWPVVVLVFALAVRLVLVWQRATPNYFPDEYIYAALGRSFAGFHGPLVRGHSAHFPALLQPLLTAPAWFFGGVASGYRAVQALNAIAMTVAAVPVYLLARQLRLSRVVCAAAAVLTLVIPDVLYASFVLAEPFAYPLVLGASAVGIYALARPTARGQLAFLALCVLATAARVQFGVLPVCYLVAAAFVDRRDVFRTQRIVFVAAAAALVAAFVSGPHRLAGYYSSALRIHVHALDVARSFGTDWLVLLYAAGWIIVPGAVLGLVFGLWKPRTRLEHAFSSFAVVLGLALVLEASLFGEVGMVQERYVFYLLPFAPIAFGLYASRGWPLRHVHALLAVGLIAASARFPLSGWAQTGVDAHSPFLIGVQQLEFWLGSSAGGAGVVAAVAAVFAVAAIAASFRPARAAAPLLAVAVAASATVGAFAWQFDRTNSQRVRVAFLPSDPSWIDMAHVGRVTLLTSPGGHTTPTEEQLFWNRSIGRVVVLPLASRPDRMYSDLARVSRDGTILVHARPLRGAIVADEYATTVDLRDARVVRRAPHFRLWLPRGVAQLQSLMLGRFANGALASGGGVILWPSHANERLSGWLVLHVRAPSASSLRLTVDRHVFVVGAGGRRHVRVPVCTAGGLWSGKFDAVLSGSASAWSSGPRFVADRRACQPGLSS